MKNPCKILLSLMLIALCLASLLSCGKSDFETKELWRDATYDKDMTFGEGSKTFYLEVKAGEKSITFTIHSDAETVGEALAEHGLISGDQGEFGLYIKYVNGIYAEYEVTNSYWGFYQNGEYMMSGVDTTSFSGGEHYELVYETA